MPNKPANHTISGDVEAERDLRLMRIPAASKIAPAVWQRACLLLLVTRSSAEREIVGLHVLHSQSLQAVSLTTGIPLARVLDVWQSVGARETTAASHVYREQLLSSQFTTPTGKRRTLKKRKKP